MNFPNDWINRAGRVVSTLCFVAAVCLAGRAQADDFGDLAAAENALVPAVDSLDLPSVASDLGSFDDVETALESERNRIRELEARIRKLEAADVVAAEKLPSPSEASASGKSSEVKSAAEPYAVGSDTGMKASWDKGLTLESANQDFKVKVGGRTQIDTTAFTAGPGPSQKPQTGGLDPSLSAATNFRRGRFRIEGRMYEVYDFAAEYDYINQINVNNETFPTEKDAGPLTAVTDLWCQIREIPILGTVRVGNQKDPYGYEHLTSSRWLNFMERSYSQDAFEGPFNNGFVPGIQVLNSTEDKMFGWQVGEFKNTSNPFGFSNYDGGSMTVGRMVWLPLYEDEGRQLLHFGLSGRTMGLRNNQVRFRSRGSIRNGPPGPLNSIYADSGLLEGSWQNMIGLELVGNSGPWSLQSEYYGSWLYNGKTTNLGPLVTNGIQPAPGTNVGTVYYQGGYCEVLYFLTGESRTYSLIEYRFDRPIPRNTFYAVRGPNREWNLSSGAWQVGARYNYLCLSDGEVNGGVLNGMTLGLNWLLNPNARVYFNYDFTYRQFVSTPYKNSTSGVVSSPSYNGSGCINGFGVRFAFDF